MRFGYARVSKHDQTLSLQLDALNKDGCDEIITDEISGALATRPGLSQILSKLRDGDSLVVWKLDRLGRHVKNLIDLTLDLEKRGVHLTSLTEGINTETPMGKFFFHLMASLAQMERDITIERTKAGLEAARSRGRVGGRRKKMTESKLMSAMQLLANGTPPNKNSKSRYRAKILDLTGYKAFDEKAKLVTKQFAKTSARRNLKPRAIFAEILDFLKENNYELPEYSYLCDLIGQIIEFEQKRLAKIVRSVTKTKKQCFDHFLAKNADCSFISVKQESRGLKYGEIKEELERHQSLSAVFPLAETCIKLFEVSPHNIKYLASLADHYRISSLRSLPQGFSSVIICCFIYFRYQKSVDTLVEAMTTYVTRMKKGATEHTKNMIYNQHQELKDDAYKIADLLDIYTDERLSGEEQFSEIKKQAFAILDPDAIQRYSSFLRKEFTSADSIKWDYFASKHIAFKKNLRPLIADLEFYSDLDEDDLIKAIELLKNHIAGVERLENQDDLPMSFIPNRLKQFIIKGSEVDYNKYEFLIYHQTCRRIDAKDLFVRKSTKYLSLAEDLITDEKWRERHEFLELTPFKRLAKDPIEILGELEAELESKILVVNQNIRDGRNDNIVFKENATKKKWSLPYKKKEQPDKDGVFDLLDPVNISDVIGYVHQRTGFLDCFNHIQPRYSKSAFSLKNAAACLVAAGSNLGLRRMAEIADIKQSVLMSTYRNYFSISCVRDGSKRIVNNTSQLGAYKYFQVNDSDSVHAGADGQKFGVKRQVHKARHSSKYFGTDTGVVAYSLVADHLPINARIIAPNEHESHFLFDLVFNNNTEVDPDIVSTDMHGTNQVNFALLYMFGRQFAPRFTRLPMRFNDLRGFKDIRLYDDLRIAPQKKANLKLIVEEWDNILRILLSLAMKETSQSIIIRKLSSHKFSDRTKRALWELDAILRSIYLLDYIDNETLRQDVQLVQNRAEAYHRLRRAISNIAGGKFQGVSSQEVEVWNECGRLLTNCIIYYNTDLLSRLVERVDNSSSQIFRKISPVAWQHINFLGKYEFREEAIKLDLDQMISNIDLSEFLEAA